MSVSRTLHLLRPPSSVLASSYQLSPMLPEQRRYLSSTHLRGDDREVPTNLLSTQQPEAEAIKTAEIAEMNTVAVIVWRDSNFNGPTGFLMSVVPQTK